MTKRVLVVDNAFDCFQLALFDVHDNFKEISKYVKIETNIGIKNLANIVESIFRNNACDEIYIDEIGTGMILVDHISHTYHNKIRVGISNARSVSNSIYEMINDVHMKNIFINKDSIELYDFLFEVFEESSIYCSDNGLLKLGKDLSPCVRKQFHLILGYYTCNRSLRMASDILNN